MEIAAGFFFACLMLMLLLRLAVRVIAAWHRFVSTLRGEPMVQPSRGPNRNGAGIIYYRTSNGLHDYKFRIDRMTGDSYRVYVLDHPSYGSRDTNNLVTHLLPDGRKSYICFTGKIATIEQARNLAATWADKTELYILNGQHF